MIPNNNLNILPIYDSVNRQHHRRKHTYGEYFPIISARSKLPPFQIIRYNNVEATIQEVLIYRMETGDITDITASILSNGLSVSAVLGITNFDIIGYYPTAAFSYDTPEGRYYIKISDGENTWYSEVFNVCHFLNDFLKLTYWHHENFVHSGAYIKYVPDSPMDTWVYKNFIYLPTGIGKPKYEFEESVKKIDGINMPLHQVSWKQYRFSIFATEQLMDALRVVRMHSFVKIESEQESYGVDEFVLGEPEWLDRGDLAEVDIEFTTNTVIVTNGGELTEDEYNDSLGHCLDILYLCVALIDEMSPEYAGEFYAPLSGGGTVPFQDGDLILISDAIGDIRLWLYDMGGYAGTITPGGNAYVINKNRYFFPASGLMVEPEIDTITNDPSWLVTGTTFANTTVDIYGIDVYGFEYLLGTGTSTEFESTGVEISSPEGMEQIQARFSSENCINFTQSKWVYPTGIGWMEIESSFIVG